MKGCGAMSRGVPVSHAARFGALEAVGSSLLGVRVSESAAGFEAEGLRVRCVERGESHYVPQLFCHVPVKSPELSTLETTIL
jgi:hypothetical protein